MFRGLVSGAIVGAAVSAIGLGVVARLGPQVELAARAPDAGEVAVPAGSEFNRE